MNPLEMEKKLAPVLGADIAKYLARVAQAHKQECAFRVDVSSGVLVLLAERLAERA